MIVALAEHGYDVVFQPAHGLLAAKLAQHWRFDQRPRYWLELLTATAQHDSHQRDFRGRSKLTEAGAPKGFRVGADEGEISDLDQPRETVREAFFQGRYAALMVSLHVATLYESRRGESDELDALLDAQRDLRERWREALELDEATLEREYRILLWCDRASLTLCSGEVPSGGRRLELAPLPDGERSWIWRADDALSVDPWPFSEREIRVDVEVNRLARSSFESDEALLAALRDAPLEMRSWTLRRD